MGWQAVPVGWLATGLALGGGGGIPPPGRPRPHNGELGEDLADVHLGHAREDLRPLGDPADVVEGAAGTRQDGHWGPRGVASWHP